MSPILLSLTHIFTHGQICHTIYSPVILTTDLFFAHSTLDFVFHGSSVFPVPTPTFGLNNSPFPSGRTATASSPSSSPKPTCVSQGKWSFTLLDEHFQLSFPETTPPSPPSSQHLLPAPLPSSTHVSWQIYMQNLQMRFQIWYSGKSVSVPLLKIPSCCPVGWHCLLFLVASHQLACGQNEQGVWCLQYAIIHFQCFLF